MYKVVGDYHLKEKIGKGNFADVYLGTHRSTGLKYAIKAISKELFVEPKLLAGLESEIKIMKDLIHPNIIQLFKYFSSEKNFYLVVEYCAGGDLSKYIRKNHQLTEVVALNFLWQISEGIYFLHENRFIHRDLKPANVLLCESADETITLKLADFGFARTLNIAALAQTRCGTPLYMAPEILEAKEYDGKADLWSIGCIFFEMLVGTCPFKGMNEADLLNNIRTKSLRIPGSIEIAKLSFDILGKLLERTASRRMSSEQLLSVTRRIQNEINVAKNSNNSSSKMNTSSSVPSRGASTGVSRSNSHEKLCNIPSSSSSSITIQSKTVDTNQQASLQQQQQKQLQLQVTASGKELSYSTKKVSASHSTSTVVNNSNEVPLFANDIGPSSSLPALQIAYSPYTNDIKYTEEIQRMRTTSQEMVQSPSTNNTISANSASAKFNSPPLHMSSKGNTLTRGSFTSNSPYLTNTPNNNTAHHNTTTTTTIPSSSLQTMFPTVEETTTTTTSSQSIKQSTVNNNQPMPNTTPAFTQPRVSAAGGGGGGGGGNEEDFVIIDNTKEEMMLGNNNIPNSSSKGTAAYLTNAMGSMFAAMTGTTTTTGGTNGIMSNNAISTHDNTSSYPLFSSLSASAGGGAAGDADSIATYSSEVQGLVKTIFARCDLYCDTIQAITLLADQLMEKQLLLPSPQQPPDDVDNNNNNNDSEDDNTLAISTPSYASSTPKPLDSLPPFTLQSTPTPSSSNTNHSFAYNATTNTNANANNNMEQRLEQVMLASQLYGHGLTILQHLILSLQQYQSDFIMSNNNNNPVASSLFLGTAALSTTQLPNIFAKLLSDLTNLFGDLLQRVEHSESMVEQIASSMLHRHPTTLLPTSFMAPKTMLLPKCEYYMLQYALHAENDGHTEELLGHMGKACNHYLFAKKLIQGVTLTYVQLGEDLFVNQEWNNTPTSTSNVMPSSSSSSSSSFTQKRMISMQLHTYLESIEQKLSTCLTKCELLQGFGIEDVDDFVHRYST